MSYRHIAVTFRSLNILRWCGKLVLMIAAHPRGAYGPRYGSKADRQDQLR